MGRLLYFYALILYLATLLFYVSVLGDFWWSFSCPLLCGIISCTNKILNFFSYIHSFCFLHSPYWLAKTSGLCWAGAVRGEILVSFLILTEMLWVAACLTCYWRWVFCIFPLLCWAMSLVSPFSPRFFFYYHEWVLDFLKSLFLHVIKWPYSLRPLACLCDRLYLLIYIC